MPPEPTKKPSAAPPPAWWTDSAAGASSSEVVPEPEKPAGRRAAGPTRTSGAAVPTTRCEGTGSRTKPIKKHAQINLDGAVEVPEPLRCSSCSRANPPHAFYCHFDGKPLFKDLQPLPMAMGRLPFPTPFCFSNGQACSNFNQLALTCNNLWEEARELLREGIWSTFFTGMGRLDLAAAARQAAQVPDPDRGLSQLLDRFPADPDFLRPPQVALDTAEITLGPLTPGTDYTFDLVIRNQGMLLLHGLVLSNFDWLILGDQVKPLPPADGSLNLRPSGQAAGVRSAEKMFQSRHGCAIPVLVVGSKLRAGLKPLLGEIIVDTNGGAVTVPVRAAVPVRPFPRGADGKDLLADVRSPRELAQKAKKAPKEAGILFERGAVRAWYHSNGWTYPVEGPDAQGAGAVQQFFEALGLTEPPRLEIDTNSLQFEGRVGESLVGHVVLRTREAKPVYAQAWSNQPWANAGPLRYLGTKVQVPVEITVPADQGKMAEAQLTIQGNAKQRFTVAITVAVKKR